MKTTIITKALVLTIFSVLFSINTYANDDEPTPADNTEETEETGLRGPVRLEIPIKGPKRAPMRGGFRTPQTNETLTVYLQGNQIIFEEEFEDVKVELSYEDDDEIFFTDTVDADGIVTLPLGLEGSFKIYVTVGSTVYTGIIELGN